MDLRKIRSSISRNVLNSYGWTTNRKIVVIASDDWGSIRMRSKEDYDYFLRKGYPVDQCPFNRYDALESNNDLSSLFEVISSIRDYNGKPAVITANTLVANPDFQHMKASGFEEYKYELVEESYIKYPEHNNVMHLWREGIEQQLIKPQYHGREHLNIARWMNALRNREKDITDAFDHDMFTIHSTIKPENKNEFLDSFDYDSSLESDILSGIVKEGAEMFLDIWGFRSESFMAPCYIWSNKLERDLGESGVNYLQSAVVQFIPTLARGTFYKRRLHYQGQKNGINQRYLIRNAYFEPSSGQNNDWISDCLKSISISFFWNKPAIISSHRVNYMGFIDPSNRSRNLRLLKELLLKILKLWPDTEFLTTDELGNLMDNESSK